MVNLTPSVVMMTTLHYAEVVMGRWKQEFFIFEREIYLEYLDTDKMGGKVEKIYLKYFDAAKMRGKVDTLIRDKMNRLHVLHYYRLKEHHKS